MSARSKNNTIKPQPEPIAISRRTKAGRHLEYKLTVIQEPERARACGSGAKSSADRRPVDPPPVVELTVSTIEDDGRKNDITFAYEADFFLFATLESVRDIAPVRGVHPTPPQVPVLTGMPVSGMAYLDRPKEAGYFIFPDLSVRHEGRYQLSFNLYEQTKKLDFDGDAEGVPGMKDNKKSLTGALPGMADASFDFRMEIKSKPFTVYSAKKFPGLSESTLLSRTVAEQGCRVRIRRDVRMRRREKTTTDFDEPQEQDAYGRPGRYINQGQEPCSRERSRSIGSDEGSPRSPYGDQQYPGHYSQNNTPTPPQPHSVISGPGHLNFGGPNPQGSGARQFAPPQAPQAPPPPSQQYQNPSPYQAPFQHQQAPQQHQSMHRTPPQHQSQYQPPPPPPPPQPLHSQPHYSAPSQYQQPPPPAPHQPHQDRQYPQSAHPSNPPREFIDHDSHRRASSTYPPRGSIQSLVDNDHSQRPQISHHSPPSSQATRLPPMAQDRYQSNQWSHPRPASTINSLPQALRYDPHIEPAHEGNNKRSILSYEPDDNKNRPTLTYEPQNNKRDYSSTFSQPTERLLNGGRPSESSEPEEPGKLTYKRAGGYQRERPVPAYTV